MLFSLRDCSRVQIHLHLASNSSHNKSMWAHKASTSVSTFSSTCLWMSSSISFEWSSIMLITLTASKSLGVGLGIGGMALGIEGPEAGAAVGERFGDVVLLELRDSTCHLWSWDDSIEICCNQSRGVVPTVCYWSKSLRTLLMHITFKKPVSNYRAK